MTAAKGAQSGERVTNEPKEAKLSEWCKKCTSSEHWCVKCYKTIEQAGLSVWGDPVVTEGYLPGFGTAQK